MATVLHGSSLLNCDWFYRRRRRRDDVRWNGTNFFLFFFICWSTPRLPPSPSIFQSYFQVQNFFYFLCDVSLFYFQRRRNYECARDKRTLLVQRWKDRVIICIPTFCVWPWSRHRLTTKTTQLRQVTMTTAQRRPWKTVEKKLIRLFVVETSRMHRISLHFLATDCHHQSPFPAF